MMKKIKEQLGYEPSVKTVERILGKDVKKVVYYPCWAEKLGSIKAAILLQQIFYWRCRTKSFDCRFYKTIPEFEEELDLSRYEQETALSILKKYGLIEVTVEHWPPTRYFRLNVDRFMEFLRDIKKELERKEELKKKRRLERSNDD